MLFIFFPQQRGRAGALPRRFASGRPRPFAERKKKRRGARPRARPPRPRPPRIHRVIASSPPPYPPPEPPRRTLSLGGRAAGAAGSAGAMGAAGPKTDANWPPTTPPGESEVRGPREVHVVRKKYLKRGARGAGALGRGARGAGRGAREALGRGAPRGRERLPRRISPLPLPRGASIRRREVSGPAGARSPPGGGEGGGGGRGEREREAEAEVRAAPPELS